MGQSSRLEYSLSITTMAVAQICRSVGYDAAQTSALDILSDIAARYLEAVAKFAADTANSCDRTRSNLIDIVIALEDLGSGQGFAGASSSRIQASITSSTLVKEIKKFVSYTNEIPFAQPLPRENLTRRRNGHHNEKGSYCYGVNLGHIPKWLPEMPAIEVRKEVEIEESLRWDFFGGQNMVVEEEGKGEGESEGKGKEEGRGGDGKGLELPENRGRVRFEMGLKGNNCRVLSRVGLGKRVLCHNLGVSATGRNDGVQGNEKKKKKKKMVMAPA